MNCREFVEFLWKYLDEDLADVERATFEGHLAVCPHCERYLESYRRTVALGQDAFAAVPCVDSLPEEVPEELVAAILAARDAGRPWPRWP